MVPSLIRSVTHDRSHIAASRKRFMAAADERMKAMPERPRIRGLREVSLWVPDPGLLSVQRRVAIQVAGLNRGNEAAAMDWLETVSDFYTPTSNP